MREIDYTHYFWQNDSIRLRAVHPEDWEAHYINRFDTTARRLLENAVKLPPTITEAKSFTETYGDFASSNLTFTIENLNAENVGGIHLNRIDERNGTFHIRLHIDRDHRDKGYGTNALNILLKYAFFERRLNKFNTAVLEGTEAAAAMLRKSGCVEEGIRRQDIYTNGQYMSSILFGLTKKEYVQHLTNSRVANLSEEEQHL
ncbi:GNAT family N-acetyltransferase [Paenibacillus albidus]|uniref:GNAT family N-acetyltransferase n=1 Tax=Paenibacillus albidus TaxID=2041023 RepID=UPI001BED0AB5|nr:GNAT family protein [Paenibacillus albidus]MBT2292128.1 GNAT family N-acetyltransferase [Paenibacillus albidus]